MDVEPCSETIRKFHEVVFGDTQGIIALRAFPESSDKNSGKSPMLLWIDNDETASQRMYDFSMDAHIRRLASYCIPAIVRQRGKAGNADIYAMQTMLVDIDDGNPAEKLARAVGFFGQPTMLVESGGITVDGYPKLHAYWKLAEPATGDAVRQLVEARHQLAVSIGGDKHFGSAHQPIRIAGSVYHKTQPGKLAVLRVML